MIVMPANSSGLFTGYLMGRFPGRLGWIMSPDGWREPFNFIPYAFDNGAFPIWTKGGVWQEGPFYHLLEKALHRKHRPRWAAVPDVVTNREATLRAWKHHSPRVAAFGIPLAFVVQDGMTPKDVPQDAEVVFVGGTTKWKWQHLRSWTDNFPRVHVGRVNSERMLWLAHHAGAESCDGTGWLRGDQKQLAGLVRYLEKSSFQTHQKHLMKTPTKVAIAGLLSAAGAVLSALAAEFGGATPESPEAAASPAAPETPRRGRKKEEPVAPAANADPAPAAVAAPSDPAPSAATNGEITNPDYTRLRALIDPLIKGGQGPDVKAIIQKYAPDGGLKVMEKQHHAAFEKDIAALSY